MGRNGSILDQIALFYAYLRPIWTIIDHYRIGVVVLGHIAWHYYARYAAPFASPAPLSQEYTAHNTPSNHTGFSWYAGYAIPNPLLCCILSWISHYFLKLRGVSVWVKVRVIYYSAIAGMICSSLCRKSVKLGGYLCYTPSLYDSPTALTTPHTNPFAHNCCK